MSLAPALRRELIYDVMGEVSAELRRRVRPSSPEEVAICSMFERDPPHESVEAMHMFCDRSVDTLDRRWAKIVHWQGAPNESTALSLADALEWPMVLRGFALRDAGTEWAAVAQQLRMTTTRLRRMVLRRCRQPLEVIEDEMTLPVDEFEAELLAPIGVTLKWGAET